MNTGIAKNTEKKTKTTSRASLASGGICTATDICKIIKACKDSNVSTFPFNGLELGFNNTKPYVELSSSQPVIVAHQQEMGDNITDYTDERESAEQLINNLEELKITDPLGYEKFLQEGDITHA